MSSRREEPPRIELPLPGRVEGASVRVTPMLCGEAWAPPQWFQRPSGPVPGMLRAVLTRRSHWIWLPIPAYLVEHPGAGLFLIDTGLSPHVATDPAASLGRVGRRVYRTRMEREQAAVFRLAARGIEPDGVPLVVMTHLHWDHTGAIGDFPAARFIVDRREWRAAQSGGITTGYIDSHLHPEQAWATLDFDSDPVDSFATFGRSIDLFGDGSVRLLSTPGHTPGHMSLLLRLAHRELLLTADAAYSLETIRQDLIPLFVGDVHNYLRSLGEIHHYMEFAPGTTVICGHDPENWPQVAAVYE